MRTNWHLPDQDGESLTKAELAGVTSIEVGYVDAPGYRHPLWDFLESAEYDLATLQAFSILYYGHVRNFRRYLAGAITVATDERLQGNLAEILAEEYGRHFNVETQDYGPSHPHLYRQFMRSLGITEAAWTEAPTSDGARYMRDTHFALFRNDLEVEMLGAVIFGMEATTPYRHAKVATGLSIIAGREDLNIDDTFFSRHVEIDPRHGQSLILPIHDWLIETDLVAGLTRGALISFEARCAFLDEVLAELN